MGNKIRLADVRKTQGVSKWKGIDNLQRAGKIKRYIVDGYVCYDEEEYNAYKSVEHKGGRPPKESV